jgi:hypothetical protein
VCVMTHTLLLVCVCDAHMCDEWAEQGTTCTSKKKKDSRDKTATHKQKKNSARDTNTHSHTPCKKKNPHAQPAIPANSAKRLQKTVCPLEAWRCCICALYQGSMKALLRLYYIKAVIRRASLKAPSSCFLLANARTTSGGEAVSAAAGTADSGFCAAQKKKY